MISVRSKKTERCALEEHILTGLCLTFILSASSVTLASTPGAPFGTDRGEHPGAAWRVMRSAYINAKYDDNEMQPNRVRHASTLREPSNEASRQAALKISLQPEGKYAILLPIEADVFYKSRDTCTG